MALGHLAVQLHADLLVLMTDVDGLFTGPPADPASTIIHTYNRNIHDRVLTFGYVRAGLIYINCLEFVILVGPCLASGEAAWLRK